MPDDTQYQRGRARLKQMLGDLGDQAVENIARISPDMANYVVEFIFGDIQSRPGLDLKSRELVAVIAIATRGGAEPQLRAHLHGALNVGWSQQEIIELMIELAVYAGFPAALNGLYAARDVFAERTRSPPLNNQGCHPEEVCPHVLMRANDEPGPPTGALLRPLGWARDLLWFFACRMPHTLFSRVGLALVAQGALTPLFL